MRNKQIIQEYWNYYLELEEQFAKSKRFVSFSKSNFATYSTEYIQLIQAICSEIDVIGKIIAQLNNNNFKVNYRTNFRKWGYEVQKAFPDLDKKTIYFNNTLEITPFNKWKYGEGKKKNSIALLPGHETPKWWLAYNKIKHERTSIDTETKIANFKKVNLKNIIYSLGALYVLEMFLLKKYVGINLDTDSIPSIKKSTLFQYSILEVENNSIVTKYN